MFLLETDKIVIYPTTVMLCYIVEDWDGRHPFVLTYRCIETYTNSSYCRCRGGRKTSRLMKDVNDRLHFIMALKIVLKGRNLRT